MSEITLVQEGIRNLAAYALKTELIEKEDLTWALNSIINELHIYEVDFTEDNVIEEAQKVGKVESEIGDYLERSLKILDDYAAEAGLLEHDSTTFRDLFDTKLMGLLAGRPSEVIRKFHEEYEKSPEAATSFYYTFSKDTDYIRRYRISKDLKWKTQTEYGDLDITINLSKPEKDPKAIAAAGKSKQTGYPKCLLCRECEGYSGRADYPARENHRIIPITVAGEDWGFQYSPYVYYNEHCIVLNMRHTPMVIEKKAFKKLFSFVEAFPHYFLGSNADLPIVGGSILSHEHFQGGHYEFPMARAEYEYEFKVSGFEDVRAGIIKWPMSAIRIQHEEPERLIDLADRILAKWRGYTDESVFILAETDGEPHNTITTIARKRGAKFEMDLVLRNNITTEEHPLGVYHPHAPLHHIKKENIGLIEVMGLAVLPGRLQQEMDILKRAILEGKDISQIPEIEKHAAWVSDFIGNYKDINSDSLDSILRHEIGIVFLHVLEDAGVYKRTDEGKEAFRRFTERI